MNITKLLNITTNDDYFIDVLWAGDSRIYLLTPEKGLIQITKDHLTDDLDAQANLTSDCPMNNVVSAQKEFYLDEIFFSVSGKSFTTGFLIAATDGCFAYFDTPIQFEWLLLNTIQNAKSFEHWRELLMRELGKITKDDMSMCVVSLFPIDYNKVTENFSKRHQVIEKKLADFEKINKELKESIEKVAILENEKKTIIDGLWQNYKIEYNTLEPLINKSKKRWQS